jgi:hypothetical protein
MRFTQLIPIAIFVTMALPAQACLGPAEESTIFFDKIPADLKYDIAATVKIDRLDRDRQKSYLATATVLVTKVVRGKLRVGERLRLQYLVSSCGPNDGVGSSGLVIANRQSVRRQHQTLSPYTRRFRDNRIEPPRTSL